MNKIEYLEKDIVRLEECVKGIDDEIEKLKAGKVPDHALVAKKLKDLRSMRKLLDKSEQELEAEKFKAQNQPNEERQKTDRATFNKKSNSYSVVRNSYIKPSAD